MNDIITLEDSRKFYQIYDTKNNKSPNILNKYEKTQVIYERIQLIENGCDPFIVNSENYNNVYEIVMEELRQKKIPFIIKRKYGNNIEYWKLEDLEIN